MVTIRQLEKEYKKKISAKFKRDIESYINTSEAQKWIKKALNNDISIKEGKELYKIGKKKGIYPNLYWLCTIYIHPLTILEDMTRKHNINLI